MSILPFTKLSGAGNDFVLLSEADAGAARKSLPALARGLCDRRRGAGADGLLVAGKARGELRVAYFNADGSRAFCGNGSRCAAWWMFERGWTRGRRGFSLRTSAGSLEVEVRGPGRVRVRMPEPRLLAPSLRIAAGRAYRGCLLRVGVPHFVVPVRGLDGFAVVKNGRRLRRHAAFAPEGANVDFVAFEPSGLRLRTYERGVEDETLACGSGAAAAAVAGALWGRCSSPVRVRTRGGDVLTAAFRRAPDGTFQDLTLEGPARIVYSGEIHV